MEPSGKERGADGGDNRTSDELSGESDAGSKEDLDGDFREDDIFVCTSKLQIRISHWFRALFGFEVASTSFKTCFCQEIHALHLHAFNQEDYALAKKALVVLPGEDKIHST